MGSRLRTRKIRESVLRTIRAPVKLGVTTRAPRRVTISVVTRVVRVGGDHTGDNKCSDRLLRRVLGRSRYKGILTAVVSEGNSTPHNMKAGVLMYKSKEVVSAVNKKYIRDRVVRGTLLVVHARRRKFRMYGMSVATRTTRSRNVIYNNIIRIVLREMGWTL